MAFMKKGGRPFPISYDDDRQIQVFLVVQPLPQDKFQAAQKEFGKVVKGRGGQRTIVIPLENQPLVGKKYGQIMFKDTINCFLKMEDAADVEFFTKELSGHTVQVFNGKGKPKDLKVDAAKKLKINDEFRVDGHLTDGIKFWLMEHDVSVANFVAKKGLRLEEEVAEDQANATENLEGSSNLD